jgi:hypothetical protein
MPRSIRPGSPSNQTARSPAAGTAARRRDRS